ncbi:MAG TPA: hypothetical protein VFU16_09665 [Solirubrobacterales bacterium]|nr:hypothetical protein [Solirubrobacterales bacterium]
MTKLVLAITAITALTAFAGVSAASAAQYKSSSSPVNLTGSQASKQVWTVDGQSASCTEATFTKNGLATPANEVLGVVPSYSSCTTFGFGGGSVNMGTCTYNFDTPNAGLTANSDIACGSNTGGNGTIESGNGPIILIMMVFGGECVVQIASQKDKGTLTFVNNSPVTGDILVKAAFSGLTAVKTVDNGFCPLSGTGTVNNVTYSGEFGVTGPAGVNLEVG